MPAEARATRHNRKYPGHSQQLLLLARTVGEAPRSSIATVWTNKHAASSRTSVKDDRNAVVPPPANDGLHECMVDLTYQIGGLLREGAERAVSKPKGASGRSGSYPRSWHTSWVTDKVRSHQGAGSAVLAAIAASLRRVTSGPR